jgi:hypothetical protein
MISPSTPQAYEEIEENEDLKLKSIQDKHEHDMKAMREELAEVQQAVYPLLHSCKWAQIRAHVDKQVQQDPISLSWITCLQTSQYQ